MKSARFSKESGLWQGCDGAYYTKTGKCRVCGKAAGEHLAAGRRNTKPERTAEHALVKKEHIAQHVQKNARRYRVVITRGYRAVPLDYDNLVGGCKPIRDEIAAVIGRDDAERYGITWEYKQERGAIARVEIYEVKS